MSPCSSQPRSSDGRGATYQLVEAVQFPVRVPQVAVQEGEAVFIKLLEPLLPFDADQGAASTEIWKVDANHAGFLLSASRAFQARWRAAELFHPASHEVMSG